VGPQLKSRVLRRGRASSLCPPPARPPGAAPPPNPAAPPCPRLHPHAAGGCAAAAILAPRAAGSSQPAEVHSHVASTCDPAAFPPSPLPHSIVEIDPEARWRPKVPPSFMGLSWEWTNLTDCLTQPRLPEMLNYLTSFGGGPLLIRIGGSSTDDWTYTQRAEVYQAMTAIHQATGARFLLGVNLAAANPSLSLQQMQAAQAQMPPEAIVTYEIGNEVRGFGGGSEQRPRLRGAVAVARGP
jgi:hypothetical protein